MHGITHVESKQNKIKSNTEMESRKNGCQGLGGEVNKERSVKQYKLEKRTNTY